MAICVALASGCGGGGSAAIDAPAADDAPAIDAPDAPVDAAVDAATTGAVLIANDGTATITQWMAPATYAGTTTHLQLFIYNTGTAPTGALAATLTGADAASFAIVTSGTTCGPSLLAGDGCHVDLAFAPSSVGTKTAMLLVVGSGATLTLPISGVVPLMPSGTLVADAATIDFGTVISGDNPVDAQVVLSNAGIAAITLGARTTTGAMFTNIGDNCPATLTPGGACTVNLRFQNSPLGSSTGTFDVASSGGAVSIPLHGTTLRKIDIGSVGAGSFGTGSVVSSPAGITCGGGSSVCSAGFPLGVPVTFTATPAASNMFVTWGGLCSGSAACTVASPLQGTVRVQFVPTSAKKITVTFAGTGKSLVNAHMTNSQFGSYGSCTSDCIIYVPQNAQVEVVGVSPSMFVGWSGDCTTTTHICALGTIANDRAVTVTSNLDQYEVLSMFPPIDLMTGLAALPNSDLVIGTTTGVTVVTLAGTIVWSTAIEGGARSIAVDAAGHVYGISVGTDEVFALSATGALMWTRSFPVAPRNSFSFASTLSVSPDGTVIGVLTTDGVHVVDGSGVDRFTITGVTPVPQAVAVSPAGTVGIAILYEMPAGSGNRQVLRYSSSGTPLTTLAPIPGGNQISLMYDANENLAAATATSTRFTTSATSPANTTNFSAADVTNLGSPPVSGVAVTASGKVAGFRMYNLLNGNATGTALRAFSSTGSVLISRDHPPDLTVPYSYDNMFVPSQITAGGGGTNRIVTGGYYNNMVWISVIDLP